MHYLLAPTRTSNANIPSSIIDKLDFLAQDLANFPSEYLLLTNLASPIYFQDGTPSNQESSLVKSIFPNDSRGPKKQIRVPTGEQLVILTLLTTIREPNNRNHEFIYNNVLNENLKDNITMTKGMLSSMAFAKRATWSSQKSYTLVALA